MKANGYSDAGYRIRLYPIKAGINEAIKNGLLWCEIQPFAHTTLPTSDRKKIDLSVESARKRINNDVTHSKSLSSANDFPKIPEKHQSKSSLVTKTLPILLLHKNILCSMASRTFPPLFLFFSLRIIMSALKKNRKRWSKSSFTLFMFSFCQWLSWVHVPKTLQTN